MKLLYCIFIFLIPLLAVPAYARVLSVRPGDELAVFITICNYYGGKTPSPPPSHSVSPSPHHATDGATANSYSNMSRTNDSATPQTSQSDQRISRNTASPPPTPKPSPTPIHRTRAPPPPPPKTSPTPTQKNRAPPPPPKGSTTPTQRTRAPPPPPKGSTTPTQRTRAPPPPAKPSPSHGQLGIWSSSTDTSTTPTPPSLQSANQMIEKFSGTTRAPPPPPNSAPPHGQLGSTFLCNRLVSMVTDYGCRKPRSSSS
ncbi:leucine-rich repeat extensin-like protein 2 [Rosa sericea]